MEEKLAASRLIQVVVGRPLGPLTYRLPEGMAGLLAKGQRLRVPLGRAQTLGFYLGESDVPPDRELREVEAVLDDETPFPPDLLALLEFASRYYRYPLGEVLKTALPPALTEPKPIGKRRGTTRKSETLEVSSGRVPESTPEQAVALTRLREAIDARAFAPLLLHGVTGSGKTEVYLKAIAHTLDAGLGALVLVPEIALTPQLVGRFRDRFGEKVAVLHSGLREAERFADWRRLRRGEAPIAVGVRSAIFAPVLRLGLVIVDEEHDGSFKQEDRFRYHARDLAVKRAQLVGCPILLGSATPSAESIQNARSGRYERLELTRRVDDRPMPTIEIVDLRTCGHGHVSAAFPQLAGRAKLQAGRSEATERGAEEGKEEPDEPRGPPLISDRLRDEMAETLAAGRQTILFLNRRGHATYLLCLDCGHSIMCDACAVSLALHKSPRKGEWLRCHYCGASRKVPERCPDCGGAIEILGSGTQRIEAEVRLLFPEARVSRLDRDSVLTADEVTAVLSTFSRGESDILIGTQMVAKGHDFPGVTLAGILLADQAMNLPDFRAAERTFQLLVQVAGRAGRGREPGRVIVQAFNPEAPPIEALIRNDFNGFLARELELRERFHYPPFTRLLAVRLDGREPLATERLARELAQRVAAVVRQGQGLRLLGPSPAPIARIKGRTRWQMLVKGPTPRSLVRVAEAIEAVPVDPSIRVSLDFDPLTLL